MAPAMPMELITQSFQSWYYWFPTIIYGFLGVLSVYNTSWMQMDMMADRFKAADHDNQDTFDFIVVGGGSAGAVVANRLSKHYNVLLLEAGGEPNPWFSVPGMSFMMLNYPSHDYMYRTVPQKTSNGALVNKQSGWSAGKALGGTSNINFLIHLRGHHRDYDYIANITGDDEWSYEGVLPHFKSIENYNGEWDNDEYHGHVGDIPIQLSPYIGMADYFIKAGEELGYPRTDVNARFDEGFSQIYFPIKNGRRFSTFKAFIEPARERKTLTIYKFSQVTKVLLDSNNEAVGVEYIRHGHKVTAYATKEVILSAGSIGSPKILMMSGIGPRKDLETVGIKVKSDLPVGLNVQDHISTYLGPFFVNETISMNFDRDVTAKSFVDFVNFGKGELSSSGCAATGFVSTSLAKKAGESNWPDIQFIFLGNGVYTRMDTDMAHAFHVDPDIMKKYFAHAKGRDSFQIIVSLARPKARGDMKLSGPLPSDELLIDPKYLDNEHDRDVLMEGVKMAINLVENTTSFSKVGGRFTDEVFPGCEAMEFRSDEYWRCFIYQYSITLHHIVGPCSMGNKDSKEAVVDTQLKVLGIKRLRVIDASVLPKVPISNTNAPAIMIGEKGSQLVLKEWRNKIQNQES